MVRGGGLVHWFGRRRGKGRGLGCWIKKERGVILVVWEGEENEGRLLHEGKVLKLNTNTKTKLRIITISLD